MKTQSLFAMIGCVSLSFATIPEQSHDAKDHLSKASMSGKHKKKYGKHCKHTSYQNVTSKIADDLNAGKPVEAGLYSKAEAEHKKCHKQKHHGKDHKKDDRHDVTSHDATHSAIDHPMPTEHPKPIELHKAEPGKEVVA